MRAEPADDGTRPIGCDLEAIETRSEETWRALLGEEPFQLARVLSKSEDLNRSATRVWTAIECLKKAGAMNGTPIQLKQNLRQDWITFTAGNKLILSTLVQVCQSSELLALAIVVEPGETPLEFASLRNCGNGDQNFRTAATR